MEVEEGLELIGDEVDVYPPEIEELNLGGRDYDNWILCKM